MPYFFEHVLEKAKEFVLWTGVMSIHFKTQCVRATSCFVEGDFGELKNNIIDGTLGRLRADKFFKIHFKALKGQTMIASLAVTKAFASLMEETHETTNDIDENKTVDENNVESEINSAIFNYSQIPAHSTPLNINIHSLEEFETPLRDLHFTENWRNLGEDNLYEEMHRNVIIENLVSSEVFDGQKGVFSVTKKF